MYNINSLNSHVMTYKVIIDDIRQQHWDGVLSSSILGLRLLPCGLFLEQLQQVLSICELASEFSAWEKEPAPPVLVGDLSVPRVGQGLHRET